LITTDELAFFIHVIRHFILSILGNIEYHRSRPAFSGNVKSPGNSPWYLSRCTDLVTPLADRQGNAHHIGFLKGIRTQQGTADLTGNDHQRGTVQHGIGQTGNDICGTGTRGNKDNTRLTSHPGKALGCVNSPLFMTGQYLTDGIPERIQGVKDGNDGTAGVTEHGVHLFLQQGA